MAAGHLLFPGNKVTFGIKIISVLAFLWLGLGAACTRMVHGPSLRQRLAEEIVLIGGSTNTLPSVELRGEANIKRDALGAAIDVNGLSFAEVRRFFSSAYGEPRFYTGATVEHGPIFTFHPKQAGIAIFISSTPDGCQITLLRPMKSSDK